MLALDHIVFNTRDRTDEAVAAFERLGFCVGARGHHTLGSINHTIVFGTDYLELLGYPPGAPPPKRPELFERPAGWMATVLSTTDADATREELVGKGLAPRPVQAFSRPVDLPDGTHGDAAFRVTRLEPDAVPGTWFYFCQHLTPHFVWRPEWQSHPNGATRMSALEIEVPDLAAAVPFYTACTGVAPQARSDTSAVFRLPGCDILVKAVVGAARMTSVTFGVSSLEPVKALLATAHIEHCSACGRVEIDPAATLGAKLQFAAETH